MCFIYPEVTSNVCLLRSGITGCTTIYAKGLYAKQIAYQLSYAPNKTRANLLLKKNAEGL